MVGADVHALSSDDQSVLHHACAAYHAGTAAELLRLGVDPNAPDGDAPLVLAAALGDVDIVRVFLERIQHRRQYFYDDGGTALSVARAEGRAAVVALLEAAGAQLQCEFTATCVGAEPAPRQRPAAKVSRVDDGGAVVDPCSFLRSTRP